MAHIFLQAPIWGAIEEGGPERSSGVFKVFSSSEVETPVHSAVPVGFIPRACVDRKRRGIEGEYLK